MIAGTDVVVVRGVVGLLQPAIAGGVQPDPAVGLLQNLLQHMQSNIMQMTTAAMEKMLKPAVGACTLKNVMPEDESTSVATIFFAAAGGCAAQVSTEGSLYRIA